MTYLTVLYRSAKEKSLFFNFAKNKMNKIAIVYSHNGCTEFLTYEKASNSDPNITREEFEKFKKISDEMFHEFFKNDDKESNHVVAVFNEDIVDDIFNMLSPEDEYISNNSSKLRMRQDYLWRTSPHKTDR